MDCPIGLICEYFECRPSVCADYAFPMPLPFIFWDINSLYPIGTLVSWLPLFQEKPDCQDPDDLGWWYEEDQIDSYNGWIERVRHMMKEGGWHGYCNLPYRYCESQQALEVTEIQPLEGDDYIFDAGRILDSFQKVQGVGFEKIDRGFYPALPINQKFPPRKEDYSDDIRLDGFCYYRLEFYEWDVDLREADLIKKQVKTPE